MNIAVLDAMRPPYVRDARESTRTMQYKHSRFGLVWSLDIDWELAIYPTRATISTENPLGLKEVGICGCDKRYKRMGDHDTLYRYSTFTAPALN